MMNTERTLGQLVTEHPAAAKVFHRHGLDFCCGGKQTLQEACAAGGVHAETVLREIEAAGAAETQAATENIRWDQRPVEELVRYILDHYHAPLRTELPRLVHLARKVEKAHADKPDCPDGLADLLVEVQAALESHMGKEEQILFPLILAGRGSTAYMPVQVMMHEHEDHGQNLRHIRELTSELELPAYACASWRELYRSLVELEMELMEHIHLENNILFPCALAGRGEKEA